MAQGLLLEPSTLLSYNYTDATSNGNSTTAYFDLDSSSGRYKGTAALAENTDGSLTFWFYDQNFEDSASVYADYFQFTWSVSAGNVDSSIAGPQAALVVEAGPIPSGPGSYIISYPFSRIQNFPSTVQISPTYDAVSVPTEEGAIGITNGASAVWVFRARLWPSGGKGTSFNSLNISHFENAHSYNKTFNDSAGPTSGSLSLTLLGATPKPVLTAVVPSSADIGDTVTLTGAGIVPGFLPYFGSTLAEVLELSATQVICVVPQLSLGSTSITLSNGSYTTNALAFTVSANVLTSGFSNELALTWPAPPPSLPPPATIIGLTVVPGSATVTEGDSQQFSALATWSDGTTSTLLDTVTWSVINTSGAGSIDPSSGLFVAASYGTQVSVVASIPVGTMSSGIIGHCIPPASINGYITANAIVTVAQRIISPTLASIAVLPGDTQIATGTKTQYRAIGTSQLGTTMYPQVTWTVLPGITSTIGFSLSPNNFSPAPTMSSGALYGNSVSTTLSSYLSATEWYFVQAQVVLGTSTNPYSIGFFDSNSSANIYVELSTGTGNIYVDSISGAALATHSGNTLGSPHTIHVGIQRVDDEHTNLVAWVDDVLVCNTTLTIGWLIPAAPGFQAQDTNQVGLVSMVTFYSSSSNPNGTATVDSYGLVTGTAPGAVTIYAVSASGIVGKTSLTISDPILPTQSPHLGSITISPPSAVCKAGSTIQFTATVLDVSGSPYPNTSVAWSVANTAGAGTIDAVSGLFQGQIAGGQIVVTATAYALDDEGGTVIVGVQQSYLHQSAMASVVVVPGPIQKIQVTPNPVILQTTQSQQFSATGYDAYGNALALSSPNWTVAGGVGTVNGSGLFTASTSGLGKVLATQAGITGAATANVLYEVGGVAVDLVPQQPFARVTIKDRVSQPLIVDARTLGGGLKAKLSVSDFWWDLSNYDGIPFHPYGVFAVSMQAPGAALTTAQTAQGIQQVLSKFAIPQALPVIKPGSVAPASTL